MIFILIRYEKRRNAMKTRLILILILSFFLANAYQYPSPARIKKNEIIIEINPKVELFNIIALLAGNDGALNGFDFGYKDSIKSHFSDIDNDQTISFCRKIIDNCGSDVAFRGLLLNDDTQNNRGIYKYINISPWIES